MDRVAMFHALGPPADRDLEQPLRDALVQCVEPEEVCRAMDLSFAQAYFERRRLLTRVVKDMAAELLPCHRDLFEQLLNKFKLFEHRRQQSCLSALFTLADACPDLGRRRLIKRTLRSPSVSLRRQAYKSLRAAWDADCAQAVEAAWETERDSEAFELLLGVMPLAWLRDQIETAFSLDLKGRALARLAIRVAPSQPEVLDELFRKSAVSWAYASAKLGRPGDRRRLRAALEAAETCDDRSLVVWSIGQLRDWDLLLELHQLPGPTIEQILERHGVHRPV